MRVRQTERDLVYNTQLQQIWEEKRETEGVCQLPTILLKSPTVNSRVGTVHTTLTDQHMHTYIHTIIVPAPWANTCHSVWSSTVHTSHALPLASACTSLQCEVYVSVCVCVCVFSPSPKQDTLSPDFPRFLQNNQVSSQHC